MISKATWLHLRIPFSFFLLPVFLFALAISEDYNVFHALIVFISLHFFLYPASNGYNSYFDKDEGSIGGLKRPPKVSKELYYTALVFDVIAIVMGLYNNLFASCLILYGLVSKAYSHPWIRLKKYPFGSWFIAGFFQGFFTFIMAYVGINDVGLAELTSPIIWQAAILTSVMLWGSYPMTQIYQHKEDAKRGDITLSIKLGILGTFYFVAIVFAFSSAAFSYYFYTYNNLQTAIIYLAVMGPVVGYFFYWFVKVNKDAFQADFEHTMKLNFISSLCLNLFFLFLILS